MRMRPTLTLTLTLALAALTGCAGAQQEAAPQGASAPNAARQEQAAAGGGGQLDMKTVSLQQTEDSTTAPANAPAPAERRIIRNATLTLEADEPAKAMQRVASIAEERGGFVVTSETTRHVGTGGAKGYEVFTIEIRVPAPQFDAALNEIRAAAGSVTAQKVTGKDVTEEYIDLEARLRTQRALEAQLMEIMKRAQEVEDAISVQRELTNVRTEIERLEGRRRFLENQSSLSTISVTIRPPAPLVSTTGFFNSLGKAFGQGVDIAANVTLFLITALLALLPVAILLGLPAFFLLRWLVRRARRNRPPAPPQPPAQYVQPPAEQFEPPPSRPHA